MSQIVGFVLRTGALQSVGIIVFLASIHLATPTASAQEAVRVGVNVDTPAMPVERWGIAEIELPGPSEGNPYIDVQLTADFELNGKQCTVTGFYDGAGIYRIRAMPDDVGTWRYITQSNSEALNNKRGEFEVVAATGSNHGPVRVHNTFHFAYADGTPYKQLGTTCYAWTSQTKELEEQTLATLAASPFNKLRMCVFPKRYSWNENEPPLYAFEGTPPNQWDLTRFNPAFFYHLEKRIADLGKLGIEADIILFHPYDERHWGFDRMPDEADDRYLRYIISRLAAFRNVWWSLANEYDFMTEKQESDWDRLIQIVHDSDPYHHLTSIHNGRVLYNHTNPLLTHASIQNGSAAEEAGRAILYRDVYRKPIVFDEIKYEGDIPLRWGNLSAEEMVHRFWECIIAGTHPGHGECYLHPSDVLWWSKGGILRGESPQRIGFLRDVLAAAPAEGVEPIDKWQVSNVAGKPGQYYLVYFGSSKPQTWKFQLPRRIRDDTGELQGGMRFHIDVLDTWNMTTTPIDKPFTIRQPQNGDYVATDVDDSSINLPGNPWIAMRITRPPQEIEMLHGTQNRFSQAAVASLISALVTIGTHSLWASELIDTSASPRAIVHPLQLEEVRWTNGFWAERFATCRDRSLPAMWEIMRGTKYKPYLQHFLIAAGDIDGRYRGAQWNDGDFYKFLEAVCAVYAIEPQPQLKSILDLSIVAISRAQRDDGYLHTPVLIRARNGEADVQPFQDRNHFEVYNMGHLMTAACLHHRVTGGEEFLSVARKTADFLCAAFESPSPDLARNSVCPSHYMGLVELYRSTKEPRYLQLATKLFEMRNLVTDGGDDNQDRVAFHEQREAVGHAVRANYLYAGAADQYLETGDQNLRAPLETIWKNVTERKMYITGGCGALYDGASPDGSSDQQQITRVHQAYGRNYQLPNVTAYNETCAAVGSVLWNWRMFLATGDARYIDILETTLYNAMLSGISLEGTDYFYVNPLRNVTPLPAPLRWSRTRIPYVTSYCCPPNVLRTIAEVNGYVYGKTDDCLWVNLFGGSRLSTTIGGQPLELRQQTNYPWDGQVLLTIDRCPESEFSIRLRIPGWAQNAAIQINNETASAAVRPGSFAEIRRKWQHGDVVTLKLPMPVQLMEANPLVEETANQVAIQRGPIVYCLESTDLPERVRVSDVELPKNSQLIARYDTALLQGVTVIEANVLAKSSSGWSDNLYRPVQPTTDRQIKTRLIPYFAWSNRGPSEMSVWLPAR